MSDQLRILASVTARLDAVVKVDCVVRKDSAYRREEFARRRAVTVSGQRISMVAPEDLILSKLDWAKDSRSQMQLDDVRNLLRSVQELDTGYMDRWAERLGLAALYQGGPEMKDTSPDMDERYRAMLMQRTGEERLMMGCAMRDTARALVEASLLERNPQATVESLHQELFLRFYGHEFDPETRAKILAAIEQATNTSPL